ncbi:hypothetical protein C8R44DRAFT_858217 [Mycena epipterygia]|nr:hypothetical protein C8R44DRAFT_858217 [Mycena epipterygia]
MSLKLPFPRIPNCSLVADPDAACFCASTAYTATVIQCASTACSICVSPTGGQCFSATDSFGIKFARWRSYSYPTLYKLPRRAHL